MVSLPLPPNLPGEAWFMLADLSLLKQDRHLWSEGTVPGFLAGFFLFSTVIRAGFQESLDYQLSSYVAFSSCVALWHWAASGH